MTSGRTPSANLADAVDIVIIAVFLYAVKFWFRRAASRRMLVGVLLLGVVYLLARLFDLYLTSLLFEAGLAIVVIILIVVFQEDLRRAFENIGTYGSTWRRRVSSHASDTDVLVEVAFSLAA
jgi:DNA integrity scanning protein DisA with diadenylate cyclase activity